MQLIAWLGGAAFLGSLAYLVYFYLVTLGSPAGDASARVAAALWNTALFTIFAAHHSLFARASVKRRVRQLVPERFERSLYVWVASLVLVAVCVWWAPVAGVVYAVEGWGRLPLWALQAFGVLVTVRGASVIDPRELAGIRAAADAPSHDALRIVGPFRFVRHPIYLGWMLMVWGTPAMTANRLLFAAITSIYLILAIPWEERSLVAAHGARYRDYQRQVPWRILPRVW